MGRLSHIDDISQQSEQAQGAVEQEVPTVQPPAPEAAQANNSKPQAAQQTPTRKSAAEAEMDFHGINEADKVGGGHLALVIIAVVIVIVIALYAANYSLHFFG